MRTFIRPVAMVWLCVSAAVAADLAPLGEKPFQEKMSALNEERVDRDKLRRAHELAAYHLLSSLQVKAIAMRLPDDSTRLEFATAAYPRTVDPENFYEVYDAFTSFSKVMRLHDRVRQLNRPNPPPVAVAPVTVTDEEMKDILRVVKRESFDQTKAQLARQILSSSKKPFLATQIRGLLQCFDFEPTKLDVAKFAYDYTYDPERYFVVNDAFDFENTKQALARYLQSKTGLEKPLPTR
jgi:hypothetical protein